MRSVLHHGLACLIIVYASLATPGCKKNSKSGGVASTQASAATNPNPPPQPLSIAAAADLQFALAQISSQFREAHPDIDVRITYGSSGNFYSQLLNHAPFDLFLSADMSYPQQLADHGLAEKDSQFTYAVGRIVLWAPIGSPFDPSRRKMQALLDPSLKRLAIANPQHAPYGRAAEAALKTYKLWDKLQPKLVRGEDIAQTAQFVQSGSADLGIIALSLARSPRMKDAGTYFLIPLEDYPRMDQGGVVLSYAKNPAGARQFAQFLTGPQGKTVLKQYGFALPN